MNTHLAFLSEVPAKPSHNPVQHAIELAKDAPEIAGALRLFSSMPPSTGVFANPVRHRYQLPCRETVVDVDIRAFTIRRLVYEGDIAAGSVDAVRAIFAGLFARVPLAEEDRAFRRILGRAFEAALGDPLSETAEFVKRFPRATPDVAMQHAAALRKAASSGKGEDGINPRREPGKLLTRMIAVHMENVAVAAAASYLRHLLAESGKTRASELCRQTRTLAKKAGSDVFARVFGLLLRRPANTAEARILGRLGAIQVHHGSAGSNMVARYLASLHTRSVSDLFTASQMTLDCGRHFGAISDMTDFVRQLERTPQAERDEAIRSRIRSANLPTFGHPEISAASRDNHVEMDPRPALYLDPLFEAIDAGQVVVRPAVVRRASMLERMYQIAFVEGVEKGAGRLRLTPNTDFGAWLVQETLGVEEPDRTLLSYTYRGFGWMMDVREQLQQPIIRPVIPPDPALTAGSATPAEEGRAIPDIIAAVHRRLTNGNCVSRHP
jgi:citrate synthase